MIDTAPVRGYLLGLQGRIVGALQAADGKAFLSDGWQRPAGGGLAPKTPAASAPQGGAPGLGRPGARPTPICNQGNTP